MGNMEEWRSGHKAWGRRRKKGKNSGRSSFAPGIFSVFFPFGRITAGTVGTVGTVTTFGTPWKLSHSSVTFSSRGLQNCNTVRSNFSPTVRKSTGSGCRQINCDVHYVADCEIRRLNRGICVLFYLYTIVTLHTSYVDLRD